MRKIFASLAVLLTLTACSDPYGRVDPMATGLAVGVGALAVGALGYAVGRNSAPSYQAPRYHGGYGGHGGYGHHYRPYGYGYHR